MHLDGEDVGEKAAEQTFPAAPKQDAPHLTWQARTHAMDRTVRPRGRSPKERRKRGVKVSAHASEEHERDMYLRVFPFKRWVREQTRDRHEVTSYKMLII
jgi:hypothetical protein